MGEMGIREVSFFTGGGRSFFLSMNHHLGTLSLCYLQSEKKDRYKGAIIFYREGAVCWWGGGAGRG